MTLVLLSGGAEEAKLELLVNNLIAKLKSPSVISTFFELDVFLRKQKIA